MKVFKKILCPLDFSEYSTLAFRYAVALAKENQASLVVCHSVPDLSQEISYLQGEYGETVNEALVSNAKDKLVQFVGKEFSENVNIRWIIDTGSPAEIILKIRRSTGADLIVMGTHGHSGYERFLMGSVTNKVLHKATVPVLTVCRPTHHFIHENESHPVQIKRILCALDYENNSRNVMKLALDIARMHQSNTIVFHAVPHQSSEDWEKQQEWVKEKLMEYVDLPQESGCNIEFLIRAGHPAEEILKFAKHENIDLIVLGHHAKKAVEELFLGSVAKRVVTEAPCPVMIAKSHLDVIAKYVSAEPMVQAGVW